MPVRRLPGGLCCSGVWRRADRGNQEPLEEVTLQTEKATASSFLQRITVHLKAGAVDVINAVATVVRLIKLARLPHKTLLPRQGVLMAV